LAPGGSDLLATYALWATVYPVKEVGEERLKSKRNQKIKQAHSAFEKKSLSWAGRVQVLGRNALSGLEQGRRPGFQS
jgi:hypothetical protein